MAGSAKEPWREEIVAAYRGRADVSDGAYEPVTLTFDSEYLRYFDRVLDEMCRADRRLPHPGPSARARLRSAAVDVMMQAFLAQRRAGRVDDSVDLAAAMAGDMENILLGGLLQRIEARGRERLASVEVLLSPRSARDLEAEVRGLARDHMAAEDSAAYLGDEFDDLRSAFVEAGVLTWLIWTGAVAGEAVPARETYAKLEEEKRADCVARRWLPAPVKRALARR